MNETSEKAKRDQATEKVRLRANDAEDLAVISAFLQDSTTQLREMLFDRENKRFAGAFMRFRRERQPDWDSCDGLTICQAALLLNNIEDVKYRGIDPAQPEKELSLLTIATEPGREHLIYIDLVFDGGAEIQLHTNAISATLEDFGDIQVAKVTPCDHFKAALESAQSND